MTIQTPEQDLCRVDGDTVTVLLPNTTLTLSMEEADSLNCILQTDLLHGLFGEMHGEEVSDAVLVADVSVPRSEVWELHRHLENIVDPDGESIADEDDGIETEALFSQGRVNWIADGF